MPQFNVFNLELTIIRRRSYKWGNVNGTPNSTRVSGVQLNQSRHARKADYERHCMAMCVMRRDL